MKRILGSLAILLVPGTLMAQTHAGARVDRPAVPTTTNGTMGTGRRDMNPPVITKGDVMRSDRADARSNDVQARREAGTVTTPRAVTHRATTVHKRKHHKGKGTRKPQAHD